MDALAMGDYGAYVWGSVGLTFAVLVVCVVQSRRRHRSLLQEISRQLKATEAKK